ncbi:hypothetical protein LA03_30920 [Burkholderia gladioli]|uniref:hypothetical protein n=1 Tax=Burkholderia gladioli TaxID=28095 RepID=UPI00050E76C8|nr:hypothetical protein [Burkholderia gladioli]AYQ88485.1 hypothetical protein EDD84_14640 [Burkholderia gladioli]KGE06630.1 hypothetical protein LA03_30920 [Burkholderia gladioli]
MRARLFLSRLLPLLLIAAPPAWAQPDAHRGADAPAPASATRFASPLARNLQGGATAATPASARCQELAGMVGQAIAEPDRRNVVVRRMGPDGQLRNELGEYDRRASSEAEYRRLGCRP